MLKKIHKYLLDSNLPISILQERNVLKIYDHKSFSHSEGYLIEIILHEASIAVRLSFDNYAIQLSNYVVTILKKDQSLIKKNRREFTIFLNAIPHEYIEPHLDTSTIEIAIECETKLYDFEKENDIADSYSDIVDLLEILFFNFLAYKRVEFIPEIEGATSRITQDKYERSEANRNACLKIHGFSCKICNFNFEKIYGAYAKNFIHVHHIVPLSKSGITEIDPARDLIPVCPNCHSVIHLKEQELSPVEVMELLIIQKNLKSTEN